MSILRFVSRPLVIAGLASTAAVMPVPVAAQTPAQAPLVAIDRHWGRIVEDFVALAQRESPSAQAVRTRADAARAEIVQARLRPNPTLSIERRDEVGGSDAQTGVGVTWPLDLFRRDGRVGVARADAAVAEAEIADSDRRLAADTRTAIWRVMEAIAVADVARQAADAARQTLTLIAARVESGAAPAIDRDVATIELARAEADVARQMAEVVEAAARVRALVGWGPDEPVLLRETLIEAAERVEREGQAGPRDPAALVERRSDLRLADAMVARAFARQDQARREGRMDASVFVSYMRMRAGFPQMGVGATGLPEPIMGRFHTVSAGVMVTLPWRNRQQGAVAASAALGEAARRDREARRVEAMNEIDALARREAAAREAVARLDAGARSLAAKTVAVVRESYGLGRATLLDVFTEVRRWLDLERAYLGAVRERLDAHAALVAALGGDR